MHDLTPHEALVVAAMSDRARYGYEMTQRIEELTDGRVRIRPGNLYRVIERLLGRGLVEEVEDAREEDEDPRRRYFRATPEGRRAASLELSTYARALDRVRLDRA